MMIPLSLKEEANLVEVVTASTAVAVVFSAIYNYGYFSSFDSSFISTLTFQDFIVGAALALIPTIASVQALLWVANSIENWTPASWFPIGVSFLIYGGLAAFYIWQGAYDYLAQVIIALAYTIALMLYIRLGSFNLRSVTGVLSLAVWAYIAVSGLGKAAYLHDIAGYKHPDTYVKTSTTEAEGRIVRMTSNFVILYNGTSITFLPMNDVKVIRSVKWGQNNG